mmetsp:Transcript_33372/g.86576  ORF Transcript_33372/g.86576 Transcript_33372/m.86576 type:complete len:592 (+) Transcript_33372:398-2173(+)
MPGPAAARVGIGAAPSHAVRGRRARPIAVVVARQTPSRRHPRDVGIARRIGGNTAVSAAAPRSTFAPPSRVVEAAEAEAEVKGGQCPVSALLGRTPRAAGGTAPPAGAPVRTPGPPALSLASLLDVSKILAFGIQEAMLQYFDKYGPVCRFANPVDLNGAAGWLMVNSPDDIEHVCAQNVKNYTDRYLPDIYKWVTAEKGILGSQGSYNRKHRRLCQPTFRRPALLEGFSDVIAARAGRLADLYGAQEGKFEVDMALQMQRLTLDIIGEVAFSYDFQQVDQIESELKAAGARPGRGQDKLLDAVNRFGEVMADVFITPMPLLKAMDRVGLPALRDLRGSLDVIRAVMLDIIRERRRQLRADPGAEYGDLLGQLLCAEDEDGHRATDEEVWHDVHDIMGAGHETTATTAAATIYCVAAHPEVDRLVAQELADLGGAPPSYADLERLPYLNQVVKEVLRMYPPIPLFPRQAAEADQLPSGHAVQAGDVVFMSSYTLGRDPTLWEDPMEFRPERFAPEADATRHMYQWLPFGAGPRMCLGAGFAQMSVVLMAAHLLQHFRFRPVKPDTPTLPIDYDITLNFGPTNGLKMAVERR